MERLGKIAKSSQKKLALKQNFRVIIQKNKNIKKKTPKITQKNWEKKSKKVGLHLIDF